MDDKLRSRDFLANPTDRVGLKRVDQNVTVGFSREISNMAELLLCGKLEVL